ncbi:helix-turn-helix domain-containing protein [Actinomadura fibrosa]|uniref:Helix-turn-helix domain-containing protein n=1 Tax=Actinomadura fibrosa TaxID=111802 RepID=A0ABW2Y106_9ACTN|nr:helix-turn-helix domain-containing protein [Actinomadura fibrosa]
MLICTDDFPPAERSDRFREALLGVEVPVIVTADEPAGFAATWACSELGDLSVASVCSQAPYRFFRGRRLISRSNPEAYRLVLNVRGRSGVCHRDHDVGLGPGDLALYETSSPFQGWRGTPTDPNDWIMATFDRRLLPTPARYAQPLLGQRLPGQEGIGALVGTVLRQVAASADRYQPDDGHHLSNALLDLLAVLLHHHGEPAGTALTGAHERTLLPRMRAFALDRLGDPELSPEMIAAAHHISLRQVHRLFHAHGLTVAGWIRERRLERCRRDLGDPALDGRPIQMIASRWGFTDKSHFSKVFRAAFEVSPHAYRQEQHRRLLGTDPGAETQLPGADDQQHR